MDRGELAIDRVRHKRAHAHESAALMTGCVRVRDLSCLGRYQLANTFRRPSCLIHGLPVIAMLAEPAFARTLGAPTNVGSCICVRRARTSKCLSDAAKQNDSGMYSRSTNAHRGIVTAPTHYKHTSDRGSLALAARARLRCPAPRSEANKPAAREHEISMVRY